MAARRAIGQSIHARTSTLYYFFLGGGRGGGWGGGGGGNYVQSIRAGTMITSVLPVRATGQSIHARTIITSVLPVRALGQSIHARTIITSVLPVRVIGQSIHGRTMITYMSPLRAISQNFHGRTMITYMSKPRFMTALTSPKPRPQRNLVNFSLDFGPISHANKLRPSKYCPCHVICPSQLCRVLFGARLRSGGTFEEFPSKDHLRPTPM